jgi:hypothetical protein
MLSEALGLELGGLSTLQRKLLLELVQRRYPQFWSNFTSHKYSWQRQKESLEEFMQNHQIELVKEFAKAGFSITAKGSSPSEKTKTSTFLKPFQKKLTLLRNKVHNRTHSNS